MKLNQAIRTVFVAFLVLSVAGSVHAAKGKGAGDPGEGKTGGLIPVTITFRDALDDRIGSDNSTSYIDGVDGVVVAPRQNERQWLPVATERGNREITRFWVSPDQQVILYAGSREGVHRVCPWVRGAVRQPFCRRFESRLVGACGIGDDIIIVLASGDIHRVNYALVNAGGNFEPAYDHPDTLQLTAALLLEPDCLSRDGTLPNILAINAASELLQFDGKAWRVQEWVKNGGNAAIDSLLESYLCAR